MGDVQMLRSLEICSTKGNRPLPADLYLPGRSMLAGDRGMPAVLHLHGGGWRTGSRSSLGPLLDGFGLDVFNRLARAGFAVLSADYRLTDEAVFPAQLRDARGALRWLHNNAARYGIDPERIFAWGESAGGHLAALLGMAASNDGGNEADGQRPGIGGTRPLAGVVAWYAPTDLLRMGAQRRPDAVANADVLDSREAALIGGPVQENPAAAEAASPINYVSAAAPPVLLIHGTEDRFVPVQQSIGFSEALKEGGSKVELLLIEGADHMWSTAERTPAAAEKAIDATVDFLVRHSGPARA